MCPILSCCGQDDVYDVSAAGSNPRRGNKKTRTSNGGGGGKDNKKPIPKIVDAQALARTKSSAYTCKIEAVMTKLTSQAEESKEVFANDSSILEVFSNLLEKEVTENDIDKCIRDGSDPFGLSNKKTLYKCCFQFFSRQQMAAAFLGKVATPKLDLKDMDDCMGVAATNAIREMAKKLTSNYRLFSVVTVTVTRCHLRSCSLFKRVESRGRVASSRKTLRGKL